MNSIDEKVRMHLQHAGWHNNAPRRLNHDGDTGSLLVIHAEKKRFGLWRFLRAKWIGTTPRDCPTNQ